VGQIVAVLFIAYGILRFFGGAGINGLWLAFIGWFLLQAAGASYLQLQMGALLAGVRVSDLMSSDPVSVAPDTTLDRLVHDYLLRGGRRCVLVSDDGGMVGLVTPHEIRGIEAAMWPQTRVAEIMRPLSKIHFVSPEMPAMEALETMGREDVNQLPVMSEGRVVGIVSRAHIVQQLQLRAQLQH